MHMPITRTNNRRMNGDIVLSFASIFRQTSYSNEFARARRWCTFPTMPIVPLSYLCHFFQNTEQIHVPLHVEAQKNVFPARALRWHNTRSFPCQNGERPSIRDIMVAISIDVVHRWLEREGTKAREWTRPDQKSCIHKRDARWTLFHTRNMVWEA